MKKIEAALVAEQEGEFQLVDAQLDEIQDHEILVRIVATGLCHTDLSVRDGIQPASYPTVLGHEGAGVVEKVGSHVTTVEPGDHVVLTYGSCGKCRPCQEGDPTYCDDFFALNFGGKRMATDKASIKNGHDDITARFFQQSSFATHAIGTERNTIKVTKEAPLELLGPLGCGIQTGAGSVLNSFNPRAGSTIAIFGVGSVGLSAIMAARLCGCTTIIAADIQPQRLEMAKELGATHLINSKEEDPVERIQEITRGGTDYALECSGIDKVLRQAVDGLNKRGVCGIVGAPALGSEVELDINGLLVGGKKVIGLAEGDSVGDVFIPRLIDLYLQGKFPFDELIRYYNFKDINQAVADMESGKVIKPILRMA